MFTLFLEKYVTPLVGAAGLVLGLYLSHLYHAAIEAKQSKDLIAQIEKQKTLDNKTIVQLQLDQETLRQSYIKLGEKLHETKITTTPCTITTDGIKLWNQSSGLTQDLPTDTKGTSESTNASSGISAEDIFQNKLENDEICNGLRKQINAIIKWSNDTYGE